MKQYMMHKGRRIEVYSADTPRLPSHELLDEWASYYVTGQVMNPAIELVYVVCNCCGKEIGPTWNDHVAVSKLGRRGRCWSCPMLPDPDRVETRRILDQMEKDSRAAKGS